MATYKKKLCSEPQLSSSLPVSPQVSAARLRLLQAREGRSKYPKHAGCPAQLLKADRDSPNPTPQVLLRTGPPTPSSQAGTRPGSYNLRKEAQVMGTQRSLSISIARRPTFPRGPKGLSYSKGACSGPGAEFKLVGRRYLPACLHPPGQRPLLRPGHAPKSGHAPRPGATPLTRKPRKPRPRPDALPLGQTHRALSHAPSFARKRRTPRLSLGSPASTPEAPPSPTQSLAPPPVAL